jgi:hypothetical protein
MKPEEKARQRIDRLLDAAGWSVQDMARLNLSASLGVAVREFPVESGFADYVLFVDRQAVGVIEAKPVGTTLSGVAEQSEAYVTSFPPHIPHVQLPLPFAYESTGIETFFRDERDPEARSRRVFAFHQPATLQEWLSQEDTLGPQRRAGLRAVGVHQGGEGTAGGGGEGQEEKSETGTVATVGVAQNGQSVKQHVEGASHQSAMQMWSTPVQVLQRRKRTPD